MNEPPIILVGFMGAGKTRVGKYVSQALKWPCIDLDEEISLKAGKTIPEIFAEEGEKGFRRRERESLQAVMDRERCVVSCGGGIVCQPDALDLLVKQPRAVCLRLRPETAFKRVGNDPNRPLLHGPDPFGRLTRLLAERQPHYERIPCQIDVDHLQTHEVGRLILTAFGLEAVDDSGR